MLAGLNCRRGRRIMYAKRTKIHLSKRGVIMSEKVKTNTNRITNNNNFLAALALIVIGVIFCYEQSSIVDLALIIFGTILTVLGLLELYYKNIIVGIIEVALGIALIVLAVLAANVALIILGIAILLFAIYFMIVNMNLLKSGSALQKAVVILAILFMIVVAALFIAAYWEAVNAIFIAIGALSIAAGVFIILRSITLK